MGLKHYKVLTWFFAVVIIAVGYRNLPSVEAPPKTILDFAFVDPLIEGQKLSEPVVSVEEIGAAVDAMLLDVDFLHAYDGIELIAGGLLEGTGIYHLQFSIAGGKRDTYAYAVQGGHDCAALIIPGSGVNQSYAIINGEGYHGNVASILAGYCDVYVYIKPNEAARAIHDGEKKLSYDFITNRLISMGGSYSQTYLVEAMALAKRLKENHEITVIVGLSQGGGGAMLIALQAEPDRAIIASGFSTIQYTTKHAATDQIMIPGLDRDLTLPDIKDLLGQSQTRWLFSYGRQEKGIFLHEVETGESCQWLKSSGADAECVVHDGEHIFPTDIIERFYGITR